MSSSSPRTVATLALLALEIFEPMVGEAGNQLAGPEPLTGEDELIFLDK